MKYTLEWTYLGEYSQEFAIEDCTNSLVDDVTEWFHSNRPITTLIGYLCDDQGYIIAIIH